jgi:ABC-type transport system involved in Fe-S cluster assembly fused permease/ATPase subunit
LLSWAILVTYLIQSILDLAPGAAFRKDSHIHALSEVLLWTTLALSLTNNQSTASRPYFATWVLTLILEIGNVGLSLATVRLHRPSLVVQLFSLGFITALPILDLFPRARTPQSTEDAHERRPLLARSNSSDSSHVFPEAEPVHESDTESDDDDSDEEVKELQQERLKSTGGWIGYIKEFGIFWPYIWPARNLRLMFCICLLLTNILITRVLHVLAPRQLGIAIDRLTTERRIPWLDLFLYALFSLLASDSTGFEALNEILAPRVTAWSFQQLTIAAFDHVMRLSMDFHDEKASGEIIKALEQANSLNSLLKILVLEVVPGVLDVVISLWYVAYLLDGYAVLIVVAVAIAFTFLTAYITVFVKTSRRDLSARERDSSRLLYETISNWSVVSYFNRKGYEKVRLAGILKGVAQADLRSNDSYVYLYGAQEFCERVGELGILVLAAYRISQGLAPIGTFIAVESYWTTITMPLFVMGHSYRQLTSDLIDAERLLQLFKSTPTVQDVEPAKTIDVSAGAVEFDDVSFGYNKSKLALDHFSFEALPGQTVALVGETGSGKSTILKILMHYYDLISGRILIDGQDIRLVTQDSLREVFGVVPQQTVLFNTTVLENVRYAKLDASDEEVFEACKAAAIHDKILTFNNGYHTKVGERGIKLSGGEMQRISIARVILKRPRIVLLDEATSAIDTITEAKIQTALRNLTSHRTTFVIAHRLSTVVDADLVLVIDHGRIVEKGTHQHLLVHGKRYKELWTKQASPA